MFKTLSLSNFKGIDNLKELEIKPITIISGTNSSGKSSVLQSLLLLKQNMGSSIAEGPITFNGNFVHLGTFLDVVHGRQKDREISISLKFSLTPQREVGEELPTWYWLREFVPRENNVRLAEVEYSIVLERLNDDNSPNGDHEEDVAVKHMEFSVLVESHKSSVVLEREGKRRYKARWKNISPRRGTSTGSGRVSVGFTGLLPDVIRFAEEDTSASTMFNTLRAIRYILRREVNVLRYIGPLRHEPQRRYIREEDFREVGTKGQYSPYIFHKEQNKKLKDVAMYSFSDEKFYNVAEISLRDALIDWMDGLGIKGFASSSREELLKLVMDSPSGAKVSIADVGFGVSQIFPILLEGLRMPKGDILVLEQPEIHLHPNLQMNLADFLISLAMSGKNVIVETHSDHVINRLVRRVVEDESNLINDKVAIYFASNDGNSVSFTPVKIDEARGLVNWPKDFFDQTASEQERIMLATLKRRKSARLKDGHPRR
ncbi:AAA family ATPase [Deinococcus pimensis]|uniref:AAA family ATPase n=1 Tax=Deinococcus pimensis TaxID=309888 RepID=UPI00146FB032|nr:DUF3696 domain-containing protein [Deinococcus pimensis]